MQSQKCQKEERNHSPQLAGAKVYSLGRRSMTKFYKLSERVGKLNAKQLFIKPCNARSWRHLLIQV